MSIDSKQDSRTLTNNAAAATCLALASPYTGTNGEGSGFGLPVVVALKATNQNALVAATCTVNLQVRSSSDGGSSWGSWSTVVTSVLDLGLASVVAGSKAASMSHFVDNDNNDSALDVRLIAACTGANVTLDSEWQIFDLQIKR